MRRELGDRYGSARALVALGDVARAHGDLAHALACYREGLALSRGVGDPGRIILALQGLAEIALMQGQPAHAARLLARATATRTEADLTLLPVGQAVYEHTVTAVRAALKKAAFEAAWPAGGSLPLDQVVGEALEAIT